MASNARRHIVPAPGEPPRRRAFDDLSLSINDVIPVANATARAQLVADLAAAGAPVSTTRPLYVHRADTGVTERTTNGTLWLRVAGPSASLALNFSLWSSQLTIRQEVTDKGFRMTMSGRLDRTGGAFPLGNAWIGIGSVSIPADMISNVGSPDIIAAGIKDATAPIVFLLTSAGAAFIRCPTATINWVNGEFFTVQGAVWYRDL